METFFKKCSIKSASISSVKRVPISEFGFGNAGKLSLCDAVAPVPHAIPRCVDASVASVKQKVLYGKHQKSCRACEHGTQDRIVAPIPIALIAKIGHDLRACRVVQLPNVAEQGVVVMRARICHAMIFVIMRQMRGLRVPSFISI